MKTKKINAEIITETKKKLIITKDIENYILIYRGVEQYQKSTYEVAIFMNSKWKLKINSYMFGGGGGSTNELSH